MFNQNLAIVDIETTGMSAQRNRIIEIAVIRIEKNKIVEKFSSLNDVPRSKLRGIWC